jgi:hypothetical protein
MKIFAGVLWDVDIRGNRHVVRRRGGSHAMRERGIERRAEEERQWHREGKEIRGVRHPLGLGA